LFVIKFGKFDENEEEWPSNEGNSDGLPTKLLYIYQKKQNFYIPFSVCQTKNKKI
jgi:hypothetical protein